jgi:hypothetical protein
MMRVSLDTVSATRAKQSIVRLVRVRAAAAKGPARNEKSTGGTTSKGVAALVKEHASHRVALFYKSGWKAPVAHVHAASTPECVTTPEVCLSHLRLSHETESDTLDAPPA